jgi:NAD(P)-dependent dehydrogenase (short-subunit alcohol dehydrogenase family)
LALLALARTLPAANLGTKEGVEALTGAAPALAILVNNLGIFEPEPSHYIPDEDWLRNFEVKSSAGCG